MESHRMVLYLPKKMSAALLLAGYLSSDEGQKAYRGVFRDSPFDAGSEVGKRIKAAGAQVVGAASIVDRRDLSAHSTGSGQAGSGRAADLGVPFVSLLEIALPTYEPAACPLCAQGVAVVKPGSRPVVA